MSIVHKNNNFNKILKLLLFITIIIIYSFSSFTMLSLISQGLFICLIILSVLNKKKIKFSVQMFWLCAFISWGIFVSLFGVNTNVSIESIVNFSLKSLFYISLIIFIDSEEEFNFILFSIVCSSVILSLRLLIHTPLYIWGTDRIGDTIGLNANSIGLTIAYSSIIIIYLVSIGKSKKYYSLLPVFISMSLLTGSRKAFILICAGILLFLVLKSNKKIKIIRIIVLGSIFLWILYAIVMNNNYLYAVLGSRLEGLNVFSSSNNIDASTNTRIKMIQEGLSLFSRSPLLGFGFESFRSLSSFGTYSHSNYIELLVSSGLVGLIIYISLPLTVIIASLKYKILNNAYSLIITFISMILVMDFALVSYKQLITQVILTISIAYFFVLKRKEQYNHYTKELT